MKELLSGVTDEYAYFVGKLAGTAVTGLSSFTVYRSRNGGAATAMTTPTVAEVSAANMPGLYTLLLDEDTTITSGNDSEQMVFYVTASGMDGTFVEVNLVRPKLTAGATLGVTSGACDTVTTLTNLPAITANWLTAAGTAADFTTEIQAGLATQASVDAIDDYIDTEIATLTSELAKVPKSDSTVTWNATALASIQQEATDALNAYDPPTNAEMVARTLATADYATATLLTTVAGYIDTEIASIISTLSTISGYIDTEIATLVSELAKVPKSDSNVTWNATALGSILAQVNAALDTAISELSVATPTATPTLRTGLMLMYMALRNKLVVQTSGTDALEIYNNAGTKIASKLITDDGADYTEAEMT